MALSDVITQLDDLIGTETDQRIWKALELVRSALSTIAETTTTELTSTDNAIPRFNGTEGALQDSGSTLDDNGDMVVERDLTVTRYLTAGEDLTLGAASANPKVEQAGIDDAGDGTDLGVIGQANAGAGAAGSAYLRGGVSTGGTNGSARLEDSSGNIVVEVGPSDNTLGFYGLATPITKQTVTGLTTDPAVINLFAALEALGIIVDGHTES